MRKQKNDLYLHPGFYERRRHLLQGNWQLLDIKQLADFESVLKLRCQKSISLYKAWRENHADVTDPIEATYGLLEGEMLRREAHHAVLIYWLIRRDMRNILDRYLKGIVRYPAYREKAA